MLTVALSPLQVQQMGPGQYFQQTVKKIPEVVYQYSRYYKVTADFVLAEAILQIEKMQLKQCSL